MAWLKDGFINFLILKYFFVLICLKQFDKLARLVSILTKLVGSSIFVTTAFLCNIYISILNPLSGAVSSIMWSVRR